MTSHPHHIFLLQTGGTIASTLHEGCIDVDSQKGDALIQAYQEMANQPVTFDVRRPFTILSENLEPFHWSQMIDALKAVDFSRYEGIILTHGSDTLAYTAAALSYFFASTPIPIVLVCSNHPLGHPASNALTNFSSAVDFILRAGTPGVFAIYQNKDGQNKIHLGSRLLEADWVLDNFESFGGQPFGIQENPCQTLNIGTPSTKTLKARPHNTNWDKTPWFKTQILGLRAYPGLNYNYLHFGENAPGAVLHALYHSATGNAAGQDGTSLVAFIKSTPQIPHYLISFKDTAGDLYATGHALLQAGAIPLENISFEAAIVKLYFAYNQEKMLPRTFMETHHFFESLN